MPVITRRSTEQNKTAYSNQSVKSYSMKYSKNTKPEILSLQEEHAALNREIQEIQEWWFQLHELGKPHFGEMADRISALRDLLAAHFCHEENTFDLPMVLQLSTDKVYQVADLQDEHEQFLNDLRDIVDRLKKESTEYQYWGDAQNDLEAFIDRLSAHEAAGEAILAALSRDESVNNGQKS
ncbi:hemerythrin domain-containing protein [Gimesia maris]|jgi:iron-sulfur cluster repair protein YtfE (RIC family)|uniref:Hemerythrin-like domain-containing protein n=1 Tax=Gimesia maris TaxID=122 RepID=A0A3D3R0U4_9PLAN|nr:hypothetical protein [Gimesia maris]|tara:strand:- start:84 stop:626 length:543 start_codon:yes stop_codon:yes gene_type:complete